MVQYSLHDLKYFQEIIKLSMKPGTRKKISSLYLNIVRTLSQNHKQVKGKYKTGDLWGLFCDSK